MSKSKDAKKPVSVAFCPGIERVAATVADPYDGRKLRVVKNSRVHPLDEMAHRKRISPLQKAAGDRFLEVWDQAEIGGARAIDYAQVKVDMSFTHRGLDPKVAGAIQQLKAICQLVGRRPYGMLVMVIGHRKTISELAVGLDDSSRKEAVTYCSMTFKRSLDDLADHFDLRVRARVAFLGPEYHRVIRPFGKRKIDLTTVPSFAIR